MEEKTVEDVQKAEMVSILGYVLEVTGAKIAGAKTTGAKMAGAASAQVWI